MVTDEFRVQTKKLTKIHRIKKKYVIKHFYQKIFSQKLFPRKTCDYSSK